MGLVDRAKEFATRKHTEANQVRKYTGEPYVVHPIGVADLVATVPHTQEMLAAALLHDTVEDTDTTIEEIEAEFGYTIMVYVRGLTDISFPDFGNRARRKWLDREHLSKQLPDVMTIKLADLIDNSSSIIERDPKFAEVYLEEMRLLLEVLKDGDKCLWERLHQIAYP